MLAILLLALADLSLLLPRPGGMVVVVADRSASLPNGAEKAQQEIITRLQRDMKQNHELAVISVGEQAVVEQAPGLGGFNGFSAQVGSDQSRLANGLELGLSLIPADTPGRILVLSDGCWTGQNPQPTAQRAALQNRPIDYRLLQRPIQHDLRIHSVSAPQAVAKGQSFLVHAWVDAPENQPINYVLMRNGQKIAAGQKNLNTGMNRIVFRDRLSSAGAANYTLSITSENADPIPENNHARFIIGATGDLPMLCVTRTPGGALGQLLTRAGMNVKTLPPESVDWTLENLSRYSGIILENIAASEIGMRGMDLLAAWVETTGHGLMITGGKRSYGAGGYFQSPLERILPVSMELRREHRKLALAISVVLDRSGSMGAPVSGGKTKMDLANIGTVQVLDLLSEMDEFGVLAVDSAPHTILNLKPVSACRPRRNDILQIESMGGGIFIYEGLVEASKMLVGAEAGTRHIILFADAADAEQPGKYAELLEHNRMANITVSVVALGNPTDTDADLLRDVAKRGEGEIYFTNNALEIPRIFAQDTFAVARSTFLEEPTKLEWTPLMSLFSGGRTFSVAPPLGGYNLCYLRENAQIAVISTDEYSAPISAGWQAGAGRVICYTGEIDGEFTGKIAQWSEYGAFLAGMARWSAGRHSALPDEALLTQTVEHGICRISLHLDPDRSREILSKPPSLKVLHSIPKQPIQNETLNMRWENANLLVAEIPLTGTETIVASVSVADFPPVPMPPACLTYSPEYNAQKLGHGLKNLNKLAAISGGQERIDAGTIWKDLPAPWKMYSLRPALLLFSIGVLLLEIIERRVGLLKLKIPQRHIATSAQKKVNPTSSKTTTPAPHKTQTTTDSPSALQTARTRANQRFKR